MQTIVRWIIGLATLLLALTFSAMLFAVIAVVGSAVFAWFWWKTRALRRERREQSDAYSQEAGTREGAIYEGEIIRETDVQIEHHPARRNNTEEKQEAT